MEENHVSHSAEAASSSQNNGTSTASGGNGFNIEESDVINDQLIRDGQARIEQEIAHTFPLVSDLVSLDRLKTEYSSEDAVYQQKVEDLKLNYGSLRKTRPDGNCFYRAFIFAYFESLLGDGEEQKRFVEICKITRKGIADVLGFPDFTIDEFYEYFHEIVTMITECKITNSNQLLAELDQPAVYDNIVVYLRLLTSYLLQKESDFFANFIEGHPGQGIADFCKREVEPMYKESDHIHIIALSSVFDVTVRIVYMDRGAGGKVNEHDFSDPLKADGPPKEPRIHLLYRPGHYDVLYLCSNPFSTFTPTSSSSVSATNGSSASAIPASPRSPLVVQQEEADSSSVNHHDPRSPLSPGSCGLSNSVSSPLSPHQPTPPLSPHSNHSYLGQVTPTPSPRPASEVDGASADGGPSSDDGALNSTQPDL